MKNKIKLIAIVLVWASLSITCYAYPKTNISVTERRRLKTLPELKFENVINGNFMQQFEEYCLDQFPLRDNFRTLKSINSYFVFSKTDNNNIYFKNGYAAKIEYPLNYKSVSNFVNKINNIYDTYIDGTNVKTYLSIIPDKSFYLADTANVLKMDYDKLFESLKGGINRSKYLSITDLLEVNDYYKTDTHWDQKNITKVAEFLKYEMTGKIDHINYDTKLCDDNFYGVYYGQSALPLKSDKIKYLTNSTLESCTVYNFETNKTTYVYDFLKLNGTDKYDVFLSGPTPLIEITNPNSLSNRELIIFRDSFASSLAPLLVDSYSKITLVDTRYISTKLLGKYLKFSNQDVLFLYSTIIITNSSILK